MKQISELKITKSQIHQLANNLRSLMETKNVSENDISKILNIPVMTVRRIVSGETTDPRISTLKLLADYFGVTVDSLIEDNQSRPVTAVSQLMPQFIPMLDWKTLTKVDSIKDIDLQSWQEWHPIVLKEQVPLSQNIFALESRPSMQPRFPIGTLLIFDPDAIPIDGDIILVKLKKTGDISLRELIIDLSKWQLQPIVSGSETFFYDSTQHKIVGSVILSMLFFRKEK